MPAEIFSSIIYVAVYTFYIFIPLFLRLMALRFSSLKVLTKYLPSLQVSLIILFGCSFQAYFYDDFGAWFDMGTLLVGVFSYGLIVTILKLWDLKTALHFGLIALTIPLFMVSYKVFGFFNMQYEIREMFVVFGTFCYLHSLLNKIKTAASSK